MTKNSTTYESRINTITLANGFKAFLLPVSGCKTISLGLCLLDVSESIADNSMVETIATMTGEMLFKGSKNYSCSSVADKLDEMCLSGLKFNGKAESLKLGATIVASDLSTFLAITLDALTNPGFDSSELAILKNQYTGYVLSQKSDTGMLSGIALAQKLYPKSSRYYMTDPDTDINCLSQLEASHMHKYLKCMLNGQQRFIVMVGDFDTADVTKLLDTTLGKLPANEYSIVCHSNQTQEQDKFIAEAGNSILKTLVEGKSSTDIKIAFPLDIDRRDEDFEACLVATNILGGDTLTSRLGKEVREKQGLTYGITANFIDAKFKYCPIAIEITVNPNNVDKALKSIDQVMQEFLRDGVTPKELETEVMSLVNGVSINLRTNRNVCRAIMRTIEQGLELSSLDLFQAKLKKLNVIDVNMAIKQHFKPAYENCKVTSIAGSIE